MTPSGQLPSTWAGCAFLSSGFRPFFLGAAVWAVLTMALWPLMLAGQVELPTAFDPVSWHAHEALFGYLGAVIPGFLLTAVPNWTGRPPLAGWPLLVLCALWLLGRGAILISSCLTPLMVAALDLSCLLVLGGIALREIAAVRNWRNLAVVAMVAVVAAGNALFHWEAASGGFPASGYGLRMGLAAAIMMISLIGGRIVPSFTRNWLAQRENASSPAAPGPPDALALAASLLALLSWIVMPHSPVTGCLLLAAGLAQAVRMSRWRWRDTRTEPLLWILHAGYAFVPAGMLAMGAVILSPGAFPGAAAQHIWMAGAIGVMTLAVMTRATLGHAGRALRAGRGTLAVYLLVIASVLVRVLAGGLPEWALHLQTLSAAFWCAAFAAFVVFYGPLLIRPGSAN